MAKRAKRRGNPAVDAAQYRLAQAVLHGKPYSKTTMTKAAAREIIEKTPARLRSEFSKRNPAHRKRTISNPRKKKRYQFWTDGGDQSDIYSFTLQQAARIASKKIPVAAWDDGAWGIVRDPDDGDQMDVPSRARRNPGRRKRRNPEVSAAAAYREFHGKEPSVVIDVETPLKHHSVLAGLARLKYLEVARACDGRQVTISFGKGTYLTENEARNQLFITGGDQSVNLKAFGISVPHESQVLGKVAAIGYYTDKQHLIAKDGGKGIYDHPFGYTRRGNKEVRVRQSDPPTLIYDTRNKLLSFAGGSYTIKPEGIDG